MTHGRSQNTIDGNSVVGVGFAVSGNGKGVFNMTNSTVTNTRATQGGSPNGNGIQLSRGDASLLTARIENVTATGNALNGLAVDVSGSDKNNLAQPMSGTVNTVTWNRNDFSNNPGKRCQLHRSRWCSVDC